VNGQYTYVISAYTDPIILIPGSTSITNVENGDGSIFVYFETATNATSYVVYRYLNDIIEAEYYGESSPIVVSGLTADNIFSFTVTSIRTTQYDTTTSGESAMSDSITVYSSFGYGYTNDGYTVTFTGLQSHLYIPNTYSTIPNSRYGNFSNITHIIIQNGVDTISNGAFKNIPNLVDIILPNSLTEIDDDAFYDCGNLVSINIPSSVLSIADNIFRNCSKLSSLTVDNANPAYTANDNVLFNKSQSKLITYPAGKPINTYEIPSSVSEIGALAFSTANDLINLDVSNNVETLGYGCFSSCLNLKSITFNNTIITSISARCFSYCTSLQSITLPDTITIIKTSAFIGCTSLQSITLPDDTITTIENSVFEGCTSLQSITLPSNLTQIYDTTFSTCTSLTTIVIPSLVSTIGYGVFGNCSFLSSITFLGNKPTIKSNSFYGISSTAVFYYYSNTSGWSIITTIDGDDYTYPLVDLYVDEYSSDDLSYDSTAVVGFEGTQTKLLIPSNVTTISLQSNDTVTHIKIESGVSIIYGIADFVLLEEIIINGTTLTTIESSAFGRCTSLTSINLPISLTTIGSAAFNNCSSLTSINLPSSLSSIGYNIFLRCTGLTTVTVDAENTSFITIGNALFSYDGTIIYSYYDYVSTSYTLPDSVTEIVQEVFALNTIIQSITMNNVVIIGNGAFQDCTNLSSITLSNTLTTIGNSAVQNLAITSIVIPSSVTSIGEYAISLCSNLTTITFEGHRPSIDSTAFLDNASSPIIYYYSGTSGWPGSPINGITPTLYSNRDVFTPFTFKSIINNTFSHEIDISNATMTHLKRYIIAPYSSPANYLTITDNYDISFVEYTNMITYKDYLKTTFQTIADLSGTTTFSTTNFRLDSNFHNVYSIDCDSSFNLVFKNNWGKDRTTANGYISFSYTNNYLQVKSRYKYDASGTNQHTIDTSFTGTNYYVKYNSTGLSLVSLTNNATQFILYSSPFEESLPDDFNPNGVSYVTNARATINNSISNIESELYQKLIKNMSKLEYTSQIASAGTNTSTKYAAESMLATIKSTVESQGNSLRYDTSIYSTFRDGALSFQLQTNSAGNGTVGMYTVPYVYFTCEADSSGTYGSVGKYHPFMCVVSYGLSDRPSGLMDIPKPPGDGSTNNYTTNSVTRDNTFGYVLDKIPMLDYGTVSTVTDNTVISSDNLRDDSGYTTLPSYDVYNYSMIAAAGIMIDGVTIFPVMNNVLNTAQFQAEISPKGHHVGRVLATGLHYHADGHGAHANNIFNLYNNLDYVGRYHPPLIGFSLDGIALYGKYENDYSTMSGYSTALDEYGGHDHDDYGYHYHCHDVEVVETYSSTNTTLYDYSVVYQNSPSTIQYTQHVLLKGAYKGNIDEVPYFLESGVNQSTVFVGKNTT
jgi:hypothetical protein